MLPHLGTNPAEYVKLPTERSSKGNKPGVVDDPRHSSLLHRSPSATLLPPELKFHALRHTYVSLGVAAGIKPAKLSGQRGHANVRTTLDVYVHLFPDDDATEDMAASAHWPALKATPSNVVPLHG